jgi:outer membrane protein OmpA-like peptidoglycan-associated protein
MSGTPENANEGQTQDDKNRSREIKPKSAVEAQRAWNKRAEEKQGSRPEESTKRSGAAYTGPDAMHDVYEMATPPPKIEDRKKEIIPVGDLGAIISKREPPKSALKLPDHQPSAPPDKSGAPPPDAEKDKVSAPDAALRVKLSEAEQRERQAIAHPRDGVGFPFDEDQPTRKEVRRWYSALPEAGKAALKSPDTIVHITATRSKPGDRDYNQGLSERSAENMTQILEKEYGVDRSRIRITALGEDPAHDNAPDAPDDQDDRHWRVALIHFEPKKSNQREKQPEKKETPEQSIEKAKKVLERNPPQVRQVAKRLNALVEKLSDPKVDDAYFPAEAVVTQDQPGVGYRLPPDTLARHARADVHRLMTTPNAVHLGKGKYEMQKPSDDLLRRRLERLDRDILAGPHEVNRCMQTSSMGATASPWLRSVNDWIAARQRSKNSVMGVYGKYEP